MAMRPQLLRRCPPFGELGDDDVERLAELASADWVDRGEVLFRQGELADAVYGIVDGVVKLSRVTSEGRVLVTDLLGAGELIGARVLLEETERPDEARIVEDSLVARFPLGPVSRFLRRRPAGVMAVAAHLARCLRRQEEKVARLATQRVHQRLAEGLLDLAESVGAPDDGTIVIQARLTQEEMAEWVGTTRETASTLLNDLQRAGVIDVRDRRICLLDTDALRLFATLDSPDTGRLEEESG